MQVHTLWRSLEILGNPERLRSYLGNVPASRFQAWLSGYETPPQSVFLRAVDIVMAYQLSRVRRSASSKPADSGSRLKGRRIPIGQCCARCPVCDNTEFVQADPAAVLNNRAKLVCVLCELSITRGELVLLASKEVANQAAAHLAALRKRPSAANSTSAPPEARIRTSASSRKRCDVSGARFIRCES